jgi:hypothetical protein
MVSFANVPTFIQNIQTVGAGAIQNIQTVGAGANEQVEVIADGDGGEAGAGAAPAVRPKGKFAWAKLLTKGTSNSENGDDEESEESVTYERKNRRTSILEHRYHHHRYLSLLEHNLSNRRTCVVQHAHFDDADAQELALVISKFCTHKSSAHVRHLQINDCPQLSAMGMVCILKSLPQSCIERLTIDARIHMASTSSSSTFFTLTQKSSSSSIPEDDDDNEEGEKFLGSRAIQAITTWMKESKLAKWLTLEGISAKVSDEAWTNFCQTAVTCDSLQALDIASNRLTAEQTRILAEAIQTAQASSALTLRSLTVSEDLMEDISILRNAIPQEDGNNSTTTSTSRKLYLIVAPRQEPSKRSTCCSRASLHRVPSIGVPLAPASPPILGSMRSASERMLGSGGGIPQRQSLFLHKST